MKVQLPKVNQNTMRLFRITQPVIEQKVNSTVSEAIQLGDEALRQDCVGFTIGFMQGSFALAICRDARHTQVSVIYDDSEKVFPQHLQHLSRTLGVTFTEHLWMSPTIKCYVTEVPNPSGLREFLLAVFAECGRAPIEPCILHLDDPADERSQTENQER